MMVSMIPYLSSTGYNEETKRRGMMMIPII